jgi:hypothetical protein
MGGEQIDERHYSIETCFEQLEADMSEESAVIALTDIPVGSDLLGLTPYVQALSGLILAEDVPSPLTIGIFGPRGSGKTSLMKMIKASLVRTMVDRPDADRLAREMLFIWFNVGLYGSQDSLEHALIERLIEALNSELGRDASASLTALREAEEQMRLRPDSVPLDDVLFAFVDRVRRERLFGQVLVFVDELDRCPPEKAIEALEIVRRLSSIVGFVSIVAIDPAAVERAVRLRYQDSALPVSSVDYVEDIVHVPFVMPPITPEMMDRLTANLTSGLPHPECGRVFAHGLEPNLRQVKRAVNVFHFLWKLSRCKPELAPLVTPVRLAKLVIIRQRYPALYELLRQEPGQLIALERAYRRRVDLQGFAQWEQGPGRAVAFQEALAPEVRAYEQVPSLEWMLTLHPLEGEFSKGTNFVDMTADELGAYIHGLCVFSDWRTSHG